MIRSLTFLISRLLGFLLHRLYFPSFRAFFSIKPVKIPFLLAKFFSRLIILMIWTSERIGRDILEFYIFNYPLNPILIDFSYVIKGLKNSGINIKKIYTSKDPILLFLIFKMINFSRCWKC